MRKLCDISGWWPVVVAAVLVWGAPWALAVPKLYDGDGFSISRPYSTNDVYPNEYVYSDPEQPKFSKAAVLNMSQMTDLTELIMAYAKDKTICEYQSLRDLFTGQETSTKAILWWSRRCNGRRGKTVNQPPATRTESTLLRYRRKSSDRSGPKRKRNSDLSANDQKKLQALLRDKKVQCNPKKVVVELPNSEPHAVTLKPSCVYIKQCGGCCDSHYLECRPTQTKNKRFKVLAIEKRTSALAGPQIFRTITVQEHKKCSCECKVRAEHCTENQKYDANACSCYCPPEKRMNCPSGKVWDEKQCGCVCSDVSDCTTGRVFDHSTCRCLRN
ncbi:vascular endothelial growth factor D isoform X2 [Procambarus clarkii]|uniref:vascular endothelial growth factor D isoform X2 n=1 Tax=Procambarus clarkii TaxID=6728 RepID=UPI00374387B9